MKSLVAVLALLAPGGAPAQVIVHGRDVPDIPVAIWREDGQQTFARGDAAAAAPAGAQRIVTRTYDLGGPAILQVRLTKGQAFAPKPNATDYLIYVVAGRLRLDLGGVHGDVGPGDAFREIAGSQTLIEVLEDATLIEVATPATK